MPLLYCKTHGRNREAGIKAKQQEYHDGGEFVLVVTGTLDYGLWRCAQCGAKLTDGDTATLISTFPSHDRDGLYGYTFEMERVYFALTRDDKVTAYGAPWPDDSISKRPTL